jgi:hypothetical protein
MSTGRRWIRRIVLVCVALVVASGAYALAVNPLVFAGSADWSGATQDPSTATQIDYQFVAHGSIQWGIEVRNNMFLPVTIQGLNTGSLAPAGPVATEQLQLLRDGATEGVDANLLQSFAPLELAPGQTVFLAITGQFSDCSTARRNFEPGSGSGQQELWLNVSVLGFPRMAQISLPFTALYEAPAATDC